MEKEDLIEVADELGITLTCKTKSKMQKEIKAFIKESSQASESSEDADPGLFPKEDME